MVLGGIFFSRGSWCCRLLVGERLLFSPTANHGCDEKQPQQLSDDRFLDAVLTHDCYFPVNWITNTSGEVKIAKELPVFRKVGSW
jgi:hypothetical protein